MSDVAPWLKRIAIALGAIIALGAAGWLLFAPTPPEVEGATALRGSMQVTVDQEAEVRVHDRYVVAAPVSGRLRRVDLHDGDPVAAGQVLALIDPAPLDPRTRAEALARVDAAQALLREAEQNVQQALSARDQARRDRDRAARLADERFVAAEVAERARTTAASAEAAAAAAAARQSAARSELAAARAALLSSPGQGTGATVRLAAPTAGRVLRVMEKSERTVAQGTALMVIGDPARLEIVADVLSSDAVRIRPGALASLEDWGGPPRAARVRLVEPYAFTTVSALGIEEQRVNVLLDPVDTLDGLGDGYRVEARIVTWSSPDALKIPASAVFRHGEGWAVFLLEGSRIRLAPVEAAERNAREVRIAAGLDASAVVVRFPSNELTHGARVRVRARDPAAGRP